MVSDTRTIDQLSPREFEVWMRRLPEEIREQIDSQVIKSDADPGGHPYNPIDLTGVPDLVFHERVREYV